MEEKTTLDAQQLERCAELAAWHQVEADPAKREQIAAELAECVKKEAQRRAEEAAAKEKAEEKRQQIEAKKAAEKQAQQEQEAKAKAAIDAEHAQWEKEMLERMDKGRQEQQSKQPEQGKDRQLEVPQHIQDSLAYQRAVAEQRETQARLLDEQAKRYAAEHQAQVWQGLRAGAKLEAAAEREERREQEARFQAQQDPARTGVEGEFSPYEKAAQELDAATLKDGQELEGEVLDVAKVDGQHYYVVEQDGERTAVPAGNEPEYERGDEISVTRTGNQFETTAGYDYGR